MGNEHIQLSFYIGNLWWLLKKQTTLTQVLKKLMLKLRKICYFYFETLTDGFKKLWYTKKRLINKETVIPLIMFSMWEHTVLTAANSLLVPNHFSTFITRGLIIRMSKARCLKDRFRIPRGPFTVTKRDLTPTVRPWGIFTVWFETICFMVTWNWTDS